MEFSYWMIAVSEDEGDRGASVSIFDSHDLACEVARGVKADKPSWRVVVEVLPARAAHPEIGPHPLSGGVVF